MTVIEFFDRDSAVENIVSTLLCAPEKVVFIGSNIKQINKSIKIYQSVAESRGLKVEFIPKGVNRNNLTVIIETLENIIEENDNCVIDLSGGDELYLVAVGAVYEKYADRIKLHRFNINNGTMIDCDADGSLCASRPMQLSVEENIAVYGGRVIYDNEKTNATYNWSFDKEFRRDVHSMWAVCQKNASLWNAQINTVSMLCSVYLNKEALSLSVDVERAKNLFAAKKSKVVFEREIFTALEKAGVIENLSMSRERFGFKFKNEQIMKCLTKAGQLLELIIAVTAIELSDENSNAVYNDVKCGVYIDWDGVVQTDGKPDVENEMDVILMKGMVPVFISCKNGLVDTDELYKLSVVAQRFGGKFVRKVLVASELDEMGFRGEYIRARAADMGITVVENVDEMSEEKLERKISNFWKS